MGGTVSEIRDESDAPLGNSAAPRAEIDFLNQRAWERRLDAPEQSRVLAEQAQQLSTSGEFAAEPYVLGLIASLRTLGFFYNDIGDFNLALTQSLQALQLLERAPTTATETQPLLIDVFGNISWTYRSYGDYALAAEYGMRGLKLAKELGDLLRQARLLNSMSNVYAESNDLAASLSMGEMALEHYRTLGFVDGESVVLNNLALTWLQLGNRDKALETCRASLRLAREHRVAAVELTAASSLGEIYLGIGEYAQAETHLLQALTLARERGARYDEFLNVLNLGKVYQFQQDNARALLVIQEALEIARALNHRPGEFQCYEMLAQVYESRGEFESALEHFKQFHTLKESVLNGNVAKRLAGLHVIHQLETAKRDAEIHYLKTIELTKEIEERKTAQAALEALAGVDPLTGLLNRREFFLLGEREVQRAIEGRKPLTAILFDVDHLKQINDNSGHAAGDLLLIHIANMVRENLRDVEIIGRYGGDEFVILLPGCNRAKGKKIAERLREKVASRVLASPKGNLPATLSLGVAELGADHCDNLEMLLDYADQALYAAKRQGRNQVALYTAALAPNA